MSFEVIAAPGIGGNAQVQPNGNKFARKKPPVRLRDLKDVIDELGEKSSWKQLTESGPEHKHAPVHVPSRMNDTVLKEYSLVDYDEINGVMGEAQRLNAASEYMPEVRGVYEDKNNKLVYIHMEKLKETVMARIQRDGAEFLLEDLEKQKFVDLWNISKLFDGSSMCRVDNMMYDAEGTLNFIDAEKASPGSEKHTGLLTESEKKHMKECFVHSAVEAHVVYLAEEWGIDLKVMGELNHATGDLLHDYRWLSRNFTKEIGVAVLRWFEEGYEDAYVGLREEGFAIMRALCEKYDLEEKSKSLSLKTTFMDTGSTIKGNPSFETINLRLPPVVPY